MTEIKSNKSPAPPDDTRFSWRTILFAVLYGCRSVAVNQGEGVINRCIMPEGVSGRECGLQAFFVLLALGPTCALGYCAAYTTGQYFHGIRFNWRAAVFAVLCYGRYFGADKARNITDQCISLDGDDAKCGAYLVDVIATLCLLCYVGYFVPYLVARFARDQYSVKLSWRGTILSTLFYISCFGVFDDTIFCIFEECETGKAIGTVSSVLLIYFVPLAAKKSPRYHPFFHLSIQVVMLVANVFYF